jgi:hypothetical protein
MGLAPVVEASQPPQPQPPPWASLAALQARSMCASGSVRAVMSVGFVIRVAVRRVQG